MVHVVVQVEVLDVHNQTHGIGCADDAVEHDFAVMRPAVLALTSWG